MSDILAPPRGTRNMRITSQRSPRHHMSPDTQATQPPVRPGDPAPPMSVGSSRDALELIAEGVTDLAGFGIAAISVVRDDGKLELIAIAGDDDAQSVRGRRTPVASLMKELEKADDWGLLKFIPHERLDLGTGEEAWGWVPDPASLTPSDAPDAWHPLDMLVAPLYDDKGDLRGTLAMDLPLDGRRPGAQQREVLQTYAEQAGRAVVTALEREALAEQVRLAEAARAIVRNASAQLSMDRILADSQQALVEGFQAQGMWLQTFDEDGQGTRAIYSSDGTKVELPDELVTVAESAARQAWSLQRVEIVSRDRPFGPDDSPPSQGDGILCFLTSIGIDVDSSSRRSAPAPSASATSCSPGPKASGTGPTTRPRPPSTSGTTSAGRSSTPAPSSASTTSSRSCRPSTPTRAS